MKVKTIFFAGCQDAVGKREMEVDINEGTTVEKLLEELIKDHPALEPMKKSVMLSVNMEYVSPDTILHDGDEFAIIPPVSGGENV